jgi:hypothetical protein
LKEAFTTTWDRRLDRRDLLRDGAGLAVAAGLEGLRRRQHRAGLAG